MNTVPCRACGAPILWFATAAGKRMPVDAAPEKRVVVCAPAMTAQVVDTYVPHWATCPHAGQFRRPKQEET